MFKANLFAANLFAPNHFAHAAGVIEVVKAAYTGLVRNLGTFMNR